MDMYKRQNEISIEEMVELILEQLNLAKECVPENSEMERFINEIKEEIVKTKDIFRSREKVYRELVNYIGLIARQIDPWINLEPHQKAYDLPATITEVCESSNTSYQMDEEFKDLLEPLGIIESWCVMSLSLFPENTILKKRLVIYWWYRLPDTEGFERLFSRLIDEEVLIPVHREHNKAVDIFTIKPTFHKWLISNSERYGCNIYREKGEEGTWNLLRVPRDEYFTILLNRDKRYLYTNDIMNISRKYGHFGVVQLGSYTESLSLDFEVVRKNHIEVDQTDFLKKLGKKVSYLSLQGISGITELPISIGKLVDLRVLDLRACHNLEKLPKKPRSMVIQKIIRWKFSKESGWFNKLEVLDISACYLLDHMPKWVCELSNLVVLKGFVVGGFRNEKQSCRLSDLSKLNDLEKLSIRIPNCILGPKDFQGFNSLDSLSVLTITWGQKADASKWKNPEELKELKRLYIRGGNLIIIPYHDNWKVEILRLRFLEKLVHPAHWEELRNSFGNLKYVEYVGCPKPINFPNKDRSSWRNEE